MDANVSALISIIIGLIFCLFGFKVQKFVITLAWFAIGFTIAGKIGSNFIEATNTLLIVKIASGIILASLGYKLEKIALCIAVAYLTYNSIGSYITGFDKTMTFVIHIGVSLLAGIISTFFIKPILICVTSIAGATIIKQNIPAFITLQPNILFIVFVVIAVFGIIIQLKNT